MTDAYFRTQEVPTGTTYVDNEEVANTAAPGGLAKRQRVSASSASFFPVRQWNQFYNIRGQRHIATTGYIQQTLNTSGELIALLQNPTGSGQVMMIDKAEFGATVDCRFSRFGGGTASLIGSPTARPIGRTDGGTSTSPMKIYTAGNSSPQFSISVAGTLRKVAGMSAYRSYVLGDVTGTLALQPGQQSYWVMDEIPGGGSGNFFTYINFEWVDIPTATWTDLVAALQAKSEF